MTHAFFDRGERAPLEQVRSVHGVPTVAELIGESAHALGQAEHMVEQHEVNHPVTIDPGRVSRLPLQARACARRAASATPPAEPAIRVSGGPVYARRAASDTDFACSAP